MRRARGSPCRCWCPGPHRQGRRATHRAVGLRALLRAGVRIFEYQPTMLHAKSMVVDGVWSTVGSANFDNRSFQLNDENVVGVQDTAFAAGLTAAFERDLTRSAEIALEDWNSPAPRAGREVRGAACCAGSSTAVSPARGGTTITGHGRWRTGGR